MILRHLEDEGITEILDVGAGDGWLGGELRREVFPGARLTCWDREYAGEAGLTFGNEATFVADRPKGRFDLVMLMDVLEHVDDDAGFLRALSEDNSRDGTWFLVCVPAWDALYCSHDATFTHRRRYSPGELGEVLRTAGLEVVRDGDMFQTLLVPRALRVLVESVAGTRRQSREPKSLSWSNGEVLARTAEKFFMAEAKSNLALRRLGVRVPGLSTWALCRRG
jgi:hypothetical protein